ncbi:four helix bundle protein [Ochrobactrum soli]|uniref:Four helix bundle protein n=1 Tax=Ochrobactrum soli TaxID=2448455 RepID=A0A849KML3_9HYPH|nr:four helix bundle protein [[Ochrobactrum] soli]NNU59789.1 four helix bundle protein [[Ochrobactrum] soli]
MAVNSYRDLLVWQQAMELVTSIYQLTNNWPKEEIYGLTSQVRRAAVSVPANIAEGFGRENRGSYQQFLRIAQGSLKEVETHLLIAERLGYIQKEAIDPMMAMSESVGKLLRFLIRKLSD